MKLYVSCDMEGTAGVCGWPQCDPGDAHEYPVYRRYMSAEVRAAIDGAREAGVREVVVNDAHWNARNLLFEELPDDDAIRVISGTGKPWSMGQGLGEGFGAAFLTGYHAKSGDTATLAHTFSPETIYDVRVNGRPCSEALLVAALAGSYAVAVTLITGDRTIVDETLKTLPWAVGVCVKNPIGYGAVDSLTPAAARAAIFSGARDAIAGAANARPFTFDPPIELTIDTVSVEQADFIELAPGFRRIGGRSVRFTCDDYRDAYAAFVAAMRLGSAANA